MRTLPMLVLLAGLGAACAKTDRYDNPPPPKPATVVETPSPVVVETTGADIEREKDLRDAGALIPPETVPAEMGTVQNRKR